MFFEYVVLVGFIVVLVVMFYGIILIHDIPYKIAVTRNQGVCRVITFFPLERGRIGEVGEDEGEDA